MKTKRNTLSFVSDVDVEEAIFFNAHLKICFQPVLAFFVLFFILQNICFYKSIQGEQQRNQLIVNKNTLAN